MNLPTKITTARIILVAALLLFLLLCDLFPSLLPIYFGPSSSISLAYLIAFGIFIFASLTDWVDGYLARKLKMVTDLGKFLDPVADKLLVDSMLIYLSLPHFVNGTLTIPLFCVILMILRDLVVDALRFVAASKGVVLAANIFGKLKTVFQMIAIPLVLLNGWPFSYFDLGWKNYARIASLFVYLATLMSVISGVVYVYQNRIVLKEGKKDD